ncbi:MAG: NADH-quinone oxidoreductase subunit L [Bacteroidota bacterium]
MNLVNYNYTIFILLIPIAMFLFIGMTGHKMKPIVSGILGTLGLGTSFVLSLMTAFNYFTHPAVSGAFEKIVAYNAVWLNLTDFLHIDIGILLDPISVMMLVVITTVSFMVHIFSIGYMKGERGFHRFFSFLSLFSFSMLGLVVATNIFQMYIFWELVGVSSFLLISFYYEKPSAVAASKKAFIVTRFADLGFLIGILLLSYTTKTFDFLTLTDPIAINAMHPVGGVFMGVSIITWALLLIFMGGMGKSAMFPLHIWLPDAMEGPTPVSALIHAATMVVAGVYLVARLFPLFSIVAPNGLEVVAWVGAFTSLFAAVIACTQTDIKRVLAFSTMSQIGYMMLALGVAKYGEGEEGLGYMASMFHLFTHAFFKALLFLGAGSIIHAVHSNDMRDMGGLRKYMPITFITFAIGWLAICGFPGLSGFWSKDEILVAAYLNNKPIFYIAVLVAGLTAFYMSRLFFSVFFGKKQHYHHDPHESPAIMSFPLMFLAVLAAVAGFVPFSKLVTADGLPFHAEFHWNIAVPVTLLAFLGMTIAFIMYYKESELPDKMANRLRLLYKGALNKFYFDEIYLFITKKIIFALISTPIAWFDRHVVDATMDGFATITNFASAKIKGLQSGQVQQYGLVYISGVVVFVLVFIYLLSF